ncbi:clusterin [Dryobates pubescens]|uniref:clusterin n=1 Tax=Dryobates pubescens TaxID=118200 RepID=UPI0023B8D5F7|nr:clusterin [Dryobates pubescens]XP_054035752.1 clusterin [Dryobates pubescens]
MALLLLSLLGLLLSWEGGQALVPPSELKQMSAAGSKYIDTEVENAINGVKQMKTLMDKTSKDHQAMLQNLEETKRKKEEAVQLAREKEQQLAAKQEVCNETMLALWEECKPCLKHTCMRFYSRTCHSGSGLVGRQLEEFLNHSSPFSIWVNGERIDSLLEREQRQERQFEDLEERFGLLEDGVDDIFQDSTQVYGRMYPFFQAPFGGFREVFRPPIQHIRFAPRRERFSRELHPFFHHPHHGFHHLFQPLFEMTQRMLEEAQGGWEHSLGGFAPESRNSSNDRMVCREIRRNSAGCLRMRDECEKCREILSVDCWQTDPAQSQLREQLEDALRLAERFTRRYDDLLRAFQAEMLNTTALLDQLNRQFGWVSRLANLTQDNDGFLQVTTVLSKAPNLEDPSAPPDTQVTVQLFDSEPLSLTVPGDISWEDPRFMQMVAEQALRHYKENAIE